MSRLIKVPFLLPISVKSILSGVIVILACADDICASLMMMVDF